MIDELATTDLLMRDDASKWHWWYSFPGVIAALYALEKETSMLEALVVGIVVGIAVLLISIDIFKGGPLSWPYRRWRSLHAIRFEAQLRRGDAPRPVGKRAMKLGIDNEETREVWILPWRRTKFEWFTIRFCPTERTDRDAPQVSQKTITITKAMVKWRTTEEYLQEETEPLMEPIHSDDPNAPSAWKCTFKKPLTRPSDLPIGLVLTIAAHEQWGGFLSCEFDGGGIYKRCLGRLPVSVAGSAVPARVSWYKFW